MRHTWKPGRDRRPRSRKLTEIEEQELYEVYRADLDHSVEDIAKRFGMSRGGVYLVVRRVASRMAAAQDQSAAVEEQSGPTI